MKEDIIEVLKMIRFRCGNDFTIERLDNGRFVVSMNQGQQFFFADDLESLKSQLKVFTDFEVFSKQEGDLIPYAGIKGDNMSAFIIKHLD